MRHSLSLAFALSASLFLRSAAPAATPVGPPEENAEAAAASELVAFDEILPWSATVGIGFNDDYFSSAIELVAPLAQSPDGNRLLFLYPDFGAFDEGAQSFSLGLGYRVYNEPRDHILGFNLFWDHTETPSDNGFDALGLGFEFKSERIEFNVNYSLPDSKVKTTGRSFGAPFAGANAILQSQAGVFEAPIEGFNAEIGYLLAAPEFAEIRFYIGGYNYFDSALNSGGISGVHSRLEARLNDRVTLDLAYFEDEEFADGNVYGGIRFSIPLGRDEGSLTGLPRGGGVKRRMGEVIHRWSRVTTGESQGNAVALADVAFVNDGPATTEGLGAGSGGGDGSAAMPFDDIQDGIDSGRANVVVQNGGTNYVGDFDDADMDVHVYGQFAAFSGRMFGGPTKAVVDGGFSFSDIDSAGVSYFTINRGGVDDAVYYDNVRETWTVGNMINDAGVVGIQIGLGERSDGVAGNHYVVDNMVTNGTYGVRADQFDQVGDADGGVTTVNYHITGNQFMDQGSDGVFFDMSDQDYDDVSTNVAVNVNLHASGNEFRGNASRGIAIEASDHDSNNNDGTVEFAFEAWINDNEFADIDAGVEIIANNPFENGASDQKQTYVAHITGNRFMNLGGQALDVEFQTADDTSDVLGSTARLEVHFKDNEVSDLDSEAVRFEVGGFDQDDGMAEFVTYVSGNRFTGIDDSVIRIDQGTDNDLEGIWEQFDVTVSDNMVADADVSDSFLEIELATISDVDTDDVMPNVYNFMVHNNDVEGGTRGIQAEFQEATHATINFMLYGNHFLDQTGDGVRIMSSTDNDNMEFGSNEDVHRLNLTATNNTFEGAMGTSGDFDGDTGYGLIVEGRQLDLTDSQGSFQLDVNATGNTFLNNQNGAKIDVNDHDQDSADSDDHLFRVAFRDNDFTQAVDNDAELLRIIVSDFSDDGGDAEITLDIAVVGNRFMGGGEQLELDVDNIDIEGNVSDGDPPGMVTITGNTMRDAGDDAIELDIDSVASSGLEVMIGNNWIFDPGADGIDYSQTSNDTDVNATIFGNRVRGAMTDGIVVSTDDYMGDIRNNIVNDSGDDGISVDFGGTYDGGFFGNTSNGNGGDGVEFNGSTVQNGRFTRNRANNNGGDGLRSDVSDDGGGVTTGGNTATGNTDDNFDNAGGFMLFTP